MEGHPGVFQFGVGVLGITWALLVSWPTKGNGTEKCLPLLPLGHCHYAGNMYLVCAQSALPELKIDCSIVTRLHHLTAKAQGHVIFSNAIRRNRNYSMTL